MTAATFGAVFVALYVGHQVGDYWVQTSAQAIAKGGPGWPGRWACTQHVATLTATQLVLLTAAAAALGAHLHPAQVTVALAVNAMSHWWADRRSTLAGLAAALRKGEFYGQGQQPIATGAHALDQSWHVAWLFLAALIVAA